MTKKVLFLCTGNYYRSRFAEHLFNHLASEECPEYEAISRGLGYNMRENPGPISVHAVAGLAERAVPIPSRDEHRYPIALSEEEIEEAAHAIALYEFEHRPLLQVRFPGWEERVTYWQVPDLDKETPGAALAAIERQVRELIEELRAGSERN